MGNLSTNLLKGFFGGYPSSLFVLNFWDVLNEYNQEEIRDLQFFRIKLTEMQKRQALYAILESIWSYRGSYSFVSNNCSTETAQLLRTLGATVSFTPLSASIPRWIVTPPQLRGKIQKSAFFGGSPQGFRSLASFLDEASKLLESILHEYRDIFFNEAGAKVFSPSFSKALKKLEKKAKPEKLSYFLSSTSSNDRELFYRTILNKLGNTKTKRTQYLALFLGIEEHAKVLLKLKRQEQLQSLYMDSSINSFLSEYASILFKRQIEFVDRRFGIPTKNEFLRGIESVKAGIQQKEDVLKQIRKDAQNLDYLKTKLPEESLDRFQDVFASDYDLKLKRLESTIEKLQKLFAITLNSPPENFSAN